MLSHNALADVMTRINQTVERELFAAHATLSIIDPPAVDAPDGSRQPNVLFPTDKERLLDRLWIATSLFPNDNSYVYFGGADGSFLGVKQLSTNAFQLSERDGRNGKNRIYSLAGPRAKPILTVVQDYEPRSRDWYRSAVESQRETWSPVFSDFRLRVMALALSKPVYRENGSLVGVATSSVFLDNLSEFLNALVIGKSGIAFIMEANGDLIASSSREAIFWYRDEKLMRLNTLASSSELMRNISAGVLKFYRDHDVIEQYTNTTSIIGMPGNIAVSANMQQDSAGLKWIVVAAVPCGDYYGSFTGSVYRTLAFGLAAVVVTFLLGFMILRRVLRDLRKLTLAARSIGNGEPFAPLDIDRSDEIGQLASTFQEMERNLHTDRLTGLLNRESLIAQVEFRLRSAGASPAGNLHFALMFIDLDKFKQINDGHGHEEGDRVLIEVARKLTQAVRKEDAVSRFGGDEFLIYLHSVADEATATAIAEKVRTFLQQPIHGRDGTAYDIDGSIGFAIYPKDGLDVETLLRTADQRMFEQKRDNRHDRRYDLPDA